MGCSPWGRKESDMTERLTLKVRPVHSLGRMNSNIQLEFKTKVGA